MSLPPTQKPRPLTIERTFSCFATTFCPGDPASFPLGDSGSSCCLPAVREPLGGGAFFLLLPPSTTTATTIRITRTIAPSTHFSQRRFFFPPPSDLPFSSLRSSDLPFSSLRSSVVVLIRPSLESSPVLLSSPRAPRRKRVACARDGSRLRHKRSARRRTRPAARRARGGAVGWIPAAAARCARRPRGAAHDGRRPRRWGDDRRLTRPARDSELRGRHRQ